MAGCYTSLTGFTREVWNGLGCGPSSPAPIDSGQVAVSPSPCPEGGAQQQRNANFILSHCPAPPTCLLLPACAHLSTERGRDCIVCDHSPQQPFKRRMKRALRFLLRSFSYSATLTLGRPSTGNPLRTVPEYC